MIKFEDNHVTVTDNLIVTDDDPQNVIEITVANYNLTHVRNYYVSGLAKHIALHKAVSFWQRIGFGFRLVFWGWK